MSRNSVQKQISMNLYLVKFDMRLSMKISYEVQGYHHYNTMRPGSICIENRKISHIAVQHNSTKNKLFHFHQNGYFLVYWSDGWRVEHSYQIKILWNLFLYWIWFITEGNINLINMCSDKCLVARMSASFLYVGTVASQWYAAVPKLWVARTDAQCSTWCKIMAKKGRN